MAVLSPSWTLAVLVLRRGGRGASARPSTKSGVTGEGERGDARRAVAGREAATEEARLVERRLVGDGNDRVLADDRVLREGRAAHEVEKLLALALEALGAVGHDALALRRTHRAAQVGLARLAELALAALGGVELCVQGVSTRLGGGEGAPGRGGGRSSPAQRGRQP